MVTAEDFRHEDVAIPDPGPGQALVRNLYLSLDPAMRGWMKYADRFVEAQQDLGRRVAGGELQWRVDVVDGLEAAPSAINRLFTGANTGKLLVKLAAPS